MKKESDKRKFIKDNKESLFRTSERNIGFINYVVPMKK